MLFLHYFMIITYNYKKPISKQNSTTNDLNMFINTKTNKLFMTILLNYYFFNYNIFCSISLDDNKMIKCKVFFLGIIILKLYSDADIHFVKFFNNNAPTRFREVRE